MKCALETAARLSVHFFLLKMCLDEVIKGENNSLELSEFVILNKLHTFKCAKLMNHVSSDLHLGACGVQHKRRLDMVGSLLCRAEQHFRIDLCSIFDL